MQSRQYGICSCFSVDRNRQTLRHDNGLITLTQFGCMGSRHICVNSIFYIDISEQSSSLCCKLSLAIEACHPIYTSVRLRHRSPLSVRARGDDTVDFDLIYAAEWPQSHKNLHHSLHNRPKDPLQTSSSDFESRHGERRSEVLDPFA